MGGGVGVRGERSAVLGLASPASRLRRTGAAAYWGLAEAMAVATAVVAAGGGSVGCSGGGDRRRHDTVGRGWGKQAPPHPLWSPSARHTPSLSTRACRGGHQTRRPRDAALCPQRPAGRLVAAACCGCHRAPVVPPAAVPACRLLGERGRGGRRGPGGRGDGGIMYGTRPPPVAAPAPPLPSPRWLRAARRAASRQ